MTGTPRWRFLLPVAVLATLAAPALRGLPGGEWFPDVWLLLAFGAVPVPAPFSWRRAILFVLLLGFMRASVSSLSFVLSATGLGAALLTRELLHRRLSGYRAPLRLLVGFAAASLPTLLDAHAARALGAPLPAVVWLARALGVAVLWALLSSPGRRRQSEDA
jgi:hypothetical protein